MKAVKGLSLQARSQKPLSNGERKPYDSSGIEGFPEKVDKEEVGQKNSYPQGAAPSAAWLAQFDKADEAIQCDMNWWQDAVLEISPEQVPLVNEGLSSDCTPQGLSKKSRNRKLSAGDQSLDIFLNFKSVFEEKWYLEHSAS